MSAGSLIVIGVAAVAIAAVVAAFVIAFRRSGGETVDWKRSLQRETREADRSVSVVSPPGEGAAPAPEPTPTAAPAVEPPPEEAEAVAPTRTAVEVIEEQRIVEVSLEEAGFTRRQFFNRAMLATFGAFLGAFGLYSLSFLWPKLSGGFGSDVNAGKLDDLKGKLHTASGGVVPLFIPEARAYLVPYAQLNPEFDGKGVATQGVMALYQRCVHLGCRVPWCDSSQGFECPCHGSKYTQVGEYFAGPAPRNLDRFVINLTGGGDLIIKTSQIVQTPRARSFSVKFPQGPFCVGIGA